MPLSGKILHKKADNMDSMCLPFSYNFMKKLYVPARGCQYA